MNFPVNDYTPFGYLDNPYHSWKLNRSGIVRVNPPCGMGWMFPNAHKPIYRAAVNVGLKLHNKYLLANKDWQNQKVRLTSNYHSKEIINFHWRLHELCCDVYFFLSKEDVISCLITIENNNFSKSKFDLLLMSSVLMVYGKTGLWDFALTAKFKDGLVIKSFAEGPCFILKTDHPVSAKYFCDRLDLSFFNEKLPSFFATRKGSIYGVISIPIEINPQETMKLYCNFARGLSESQAWSNLERVTQKERHIFQSKMQQDNEFWGQCPQLIGDWPQHWYRGWTYDWETLRMNIRNPVGIYSTHWDAMQIQKPRVVLAETALDMMMMSYADANLSKEVIVGLFRDALEPHIPCSREDGSLNMIAEDGSECGTSPAWCFPFYCFQSIILRHFDYDWLESIYPYLEKYLLWWLENRTDEQGWGIYKCSWESGQDASPKFFIDQPTGGEIVSHLRPVDLQAGLALSLKIMAFFANILEKDSEKWQNWQFKYEKKITTMWRNDWFCDFDKRDNSWIDEEQHCDITNLAPFLNDRREKAQIKSKFEYFKHNPQLWLEWASFFFMYLEACWRIEFKELAADVLYTTVDRVYRNWDRRCWNEGEPMPGIAVECWGLDKPYGSEGYGWAATLPIHIIRSLIGYRECIDNYRCQFTLTPNLPHQFMKKKISLGIKNLKFQDKKFSINYKVVSQQKLLATLTIENNKPFSIKILKDNDEKFINKTNSIQFQAINRVRYLIILDN